MKFVDNPETAVLAAAKDMLRRGLVEGTAGNISARRSDGNIVITPSSVDYAEMVLEDLVLVDPEGAVLHAEDGRMPSTEMKLHLACYQAFIRYGRRCSPSRISRFPRASTSSRSIAAGTFGAPSTPRPAHPMSGSTRSRRWKAAAPP